MICICLYYRGGCTCTELPLELFLSISTWSGSHVQAVHRDQPGGRLHIWSATFVIHCHKRHVWPVKVTNVQQCDITWRQRPMICICLYYRGGCTCTELPLELFLSISTWSGSHVQAVHRDQPGGCISGQQHS